MPLLMILILLCLQQANINTLRILITIEPRYAPYHVTRYPRSIIGISCAITAITTMVLLYLFYFSTAFITPTGVIM